MVGYIGYESEYDLGGFNYLEESRNAIVRNGLILYLDAGNKNSYPGSGTVWYDLSGQSNNFNVLATAFQNGSAPYMDFNGSHGSAKNSSDISLSGNVTYLLWTRVLESNSNWRTLTRSYSSDHHVIIQSGAWSLGMYDNGGSGFIDSGFDQTSFPNYGTNNWMFAHFRFSSSSPYYRFSYNDSPESIRGSITNSNAAYQRGFGSIGAYHNNSTDPSNSSQYWGDISMFLAYDRVLSNSEILQNYNAVRGRYGT